MAVTKSVGSAKRFGARYGKTVKERVAKVETELRKKHKCPYCNKDKVKRVASGIWHCRGCGAKFTGKAYSPTERILTKKVKEEPVEVIEEQPKEEKAQKFKIKKQKPAEKEQFDINEIGQSEEEEAAEGDEEQNG